LDKLSEASVEELKTIKGLGLAKAGQLKACFEISKRLIKEENLNKHKSIIVRSPKDIFPLLKEKIINFHKEYYMAVSLDNRNKVISIDIISIGTLNSSLIHPRETFEVAIKNHAGSIIICHNHPSGELIPSEDDLLVTNSLVKAGRLLGIEVADHLIITKDGYFSFKEKKII
jgi:DNA repair protein RadC